MQYYYGEQNILRALDEAEFWKHQEAEHTTVIIIAANGLEQQYVHQLNDFKLEFDRLYSMLVRSIESVTISSSIRASFSLT